MKLNTRFVWFFLIAAFIVIIVAILLPQNRQPESSFLQDVFAGHEEAAFTALGSGFQQIVRSNCPNGAVSECVHELVSPNWGELREIRFAIGSDSTNTQLYHIFWSGLTSPVSVVLVIGKENGKTVINGWRGFIVSEGENADSQLLDGKRHDNELLG